MTQNLTRWNRPKQNRFIYVGATAPVYLEQLRQIFAERFIEWKTVQQSASIVESEWSTSLLEQYHSDRRDLAWEIGRTFSRACHILTEYMNVYRNEMMVRTATQWSSLRQLGGLIDYYPAPAVSATTWLAVDCKKDGILPKGFQVSNLPKSNESQQVFETLADTKVYEALNCLYPKDHHCNPQFLVTQLSNSYMLQLEGQIAHLRVGQPIILQNLKSGFEHECHVRFIKTVMTQSDITQIELTTPLPDDLVVGYTLVHLEPQTAVNLLLAESAITGTPNTLSTTFTDGIVISDLLVLQQAEQYAVAEIIYVENDDKKEKTVLTLDNWVNSSEQPYYTAQAQGYTHFAQKQRPYGWQINTTLLTTEITLQEPPPVTLKPGSLIMVENLEQSTHSLITRITGISGPTIFLEDPIEGGNPDNIVIRANLIEVGHGASQGNMLLENGDYTQANQYIDIKISDISFVPAPTFLYGFKADIMVKVEDQIWEQVPSLYFSQSTDAHYIVHVMEQGYLRLIFGDGRQGRRLPTGTNNIRISYRQGSGKVGNFVAGSLEVIVHASDLVNQVRQPIDAAGGNDLPALEKIRQGITTKSSTLGRGVSLTDIERLTIDSPSIWQAKAELITNALSTQVKLTVVPAGGGSVSAGLSGQISAFIEANCIPGIKIVVENYEPIPLNVEITVFTTADFDQHKSIYDAVLEKLIQDFSLTQRSLGQILYRGELYSSLVELDEVHTVTVKILESTASNSITKIEIHADIQGTIQYIKPMLYQLVYVDADPKKSQVDICVEKIN